MPEPMNVCRRTMRSSGYTWKKEIRHVTTAKERGPTEKKATIRSCCRSSVWPLLPWAPSWTVPATPLMSSPIIQWPDEKQAATFFCPVCCSHSFCVTHRIHVTSHVALHLLNRLQKKKQTFKQRPGTRTYGQNLVQVRQGNLSKQKHSIGQKKGQTINNAGRTNSMKLWKMREISWKCILTSQGHANCGRPRRIHL